MGSDRGSHLDLTRRDSFPVPPDVHDWYGNREIPQPVLHPGGRTEGVTGRPPPVPDNTEVTPLPRPSASLVGRLHGTWVDVPIESRRPCY